MSVGEGKVSAKVFKMDGISFVLGALFSFEKDLYVL
jgi:hypothetical protein